MGTTGLRVWPRRQQCPVIAGKETLSIDNLRACWKSVLRCAQGKLVRILVVMITAIVAVVVVGLPYSANRAYGVASNYVSSQPARVGFGAVPLLPRGAPKEDYFNLNIPPGSSASETILVSNPTLHPISLDVSAARGVTSPDSGYTYVGAGQPCTGTACWIHGLLSSITVPPASPLPAPNTGFNEGKAMLHFRVTVPSGTQDGQYLPGVSIFPPPSASSVKPVPGKGVHIVTIYHFTVTIGIAITVGNPANIYSHLAIINVVAARPPPIGPQGYSYVRLTERNDGRMFDFPNRGIVVVDSHSHSYSYPIHSDTVLPGDTATVEVFAKGVAAGIHPVLAKLWYDGGKKVAVWRSSVDFPPVIAPTVVRHGNHYILSIKGSRQALPTWVFVLMGLLGLLLLVILLLLLLLWRRRRKEEDGDGDNDGSRGGESWGNGQSTNIPLVYDSVGGDRSKAMYDAGGVVYAYHQSGQDRMLGDTSTVADHTILEEKEK